MAYVVKREVTEDFLINVSDEMNRVLSNLDDIALILAGTANDNPVLEITSTVYEATFDALGLPEYDGDDDIRSVIFDKLINMGDEGMDKDIFKFIDVFGDKEGADIDKGKSTTFFERVRADLEELQFKLKNVTDLLGTGESPLLDELGSIIIDYVYQVYCSPDASIEEFRGDFLDYKNHSNVDIIKRYFK